MSRIFLVFVLSFILNAGFFTVSNHVLADSLWKRRISINYNLFDDNRAKRVGDVVTVTVSEKTTIDNNETSTTDNSGTHSGKIDNDRFASSLLHSLYYGRNAKFTDREANQYSAEFKQNFSGKGTYDSARSITLTITAMIVEVLDNGNLVIEGKRDVEVNKEKYTLKLTGVARPIDIATDNTIKSEQMSNVNFEIEGRGWLTRAGQKGWFNRLRDILWPF